MMLLRAATFVFMTTLTHGEHREFEFDVRDWVVDFLRPTKALVPLAARRQTPFHIPDENRKAALLVNGEYTTHAVHCNVNDTVSIRVRNNLISEALSIHWHGIHPFETPWTDGAIGVTQGPIEPGQNFTYTFRAWPAGTHYWHSHMDGMQSAKGLRGPFIVHDPATEGGSSAGNAKEGQRRTMPAYDEELVVVLADEWRDPGVCLKLEGAMAGNDVCSDIDYASVNGQVAWGDKQRPDLARYPYPLVNVEKGKCYRMRMIMMASNAENYIVSLAGHQMTLVSLDGVDVRPLEIRDINMHIGERADVIFCADQEPGDYAMALTYDYACALTKGNFIPPGFHPVSSCNFYAFLHYNDTKQHGTSSPYKPPHSPAGTGGGVAPRSVTGPSFDLTNPSAWRLTEPVEIHTEPSTPDHRIEVTLGLNGPLYEKPTDTPLMKGEWYMDIDGRRVSWSRPETPTLFTKNKCGGNHAPIIDIPEDASSVEIVLNNLSPNAHNIHLHGMLFQVINVANFEWCNINKTACFLMPKQINPCPVENRRLADNRSSGVLQDLYWGCVYNPKTDKVTENLATPLRKDSFQIWQRSWAVLRIHAWAPGVWQFHCHMEQHIPLGMVTALNVLPSQQKPIPGNVPSSGTCPKWWDSDGTLDGTNQSSRLMHKIVKLQERVQQLETQLAEAQHLAGVSTQ